MAQNELTGEAGDFVRLRRAKIRTLLDEIDLGGPTPAEEIPKRSRIIQLWAAIVSETTDSTDKEQLYNAHLALLGLLGADDPRRTVSQLFVDGVLAERQANAAREQRMKVEAEASLLNRRMAAVTLTETTSPNLYIEYGQKFNDGRITRPGAPENWETLVDPSNDEEVVGLVTKLKASLIVAFGDDLGRLEKASERRLQSWFNANLCGEGQSWSRRRVWHDTSEKPSLSADTVEGNLKPDLTLTTEHGRTAAGLVLLGEVKVAGASLSNEDRGQTLFTAEAALRKGIFLRSRLYVLLTNVVSATLFVCSLNTQRQVTVESYAKTGTVDETLRLFVSLMLSSDEKLDVPFQTIAGFPVVKPLGRGHFSTVVSICTDRVSNKIEFAKLHREQKDRDRELAILHFLGQDASPFADDVRAVDFEHRQTQLFAIVGSPVLRKIDFEDVLLADWLDLLDALLAVHRKGLVHRDLRPDNFCVRNEDGKLTLIDFGCAVRDDAAEPFAGTVMYASEHVINSLVRGEFLFSVTFADDLESFVKCFCSLVFLADWNKAVQMTYPRPSPPPSLVEDACWSNAVWTNFVTATYAAQTQHRTGIDKRLQMARDNNSDGLRSTFDTATAPAEL